MRLKDKFDTQKIPFGISVIGACDIALGALGLLSVGVSVYALLYWVGCTASGDMECVGWSGLTCVASLFLLGFPLLPAVFLGRFIVRLNIMARVFQFIYSTLLALYFLLLFFIVKPGDNFNFYLLLPCAVSVFSIWYLLRPSVKELFIEPPLTAVKK